MQGPPPPDTDADADADGYLYIVDRRVDTIISGGANVFPVEVEFASAGHPGIADVVAIGLSDRSGADGCTPWCNSPTSTALKR